MAHIKTRWYSGKISTSSSVENKENENIAEPQISKKQSVKAANGSMCSKTSLEMRGASGSFIQAGNNDDKDLKQPRHVSGTKITSNSLPGNVFQFQSKKEACNKEINPNEEFNLSFKNVNACNRQQLHAIKPCPVSTADFSFWFPYNIMHTLRRKLQETSNEGTANKVIEIHYSQNDTTSTIDSNFEANYNMTQQQQQKASIDHDNDSCRTLKRRQPIRIAYKCPKRYPKFKAKFFESTTAQTDVGKRNSSTLNIKKSNNNLSPTSVTSSKILNDSKSRYSMSVQLITSEHILNESTLSPSSNEEKEINRNTSSHSSNKFKWPSGTEFELNLSSISPSNDSDTMTCSSSGIVSTSQVIQTDRLTPYEMPDSPRKHEVYLAVVEQVKEQLKTTIQESKKHRIAMEKESSSGINMMSSERSTYEKSSKEKIENKIKTTDTQRSKHRLQLAFEKPMKQEKTSSKKDKTQAKVQRSISQSSNWKIPEKNILKDRVKRFIEESKSVTTTLDIEAASSELQRPAKRKISKMTCAKSEISFSSCSADDTISKDIAKNRLKRYLTESSSDQSTATTNDRRQKITTTTTKGGEMKKSKKNEKHRKSLFEEIDKRNISAYDLEQLAAIDDLKERLKHSIKEFKKSARRKVKITNKDVTEYETTEKDTDCLTRENKSKLRSKHEIKQSTKHKQHLSSENNEKTYKTNDLNKSAHREHKTKSRKLLSVSTYDETTSDQHRPPSNIESKRHRKTFETEDDLRSKSSFNCSHRSKKIKQSPARTTLHCEILGNENENRPLTELRSSKQHRKYDEKTSNHHENKLTSVNTKTRTIKTKSDRASRSKAGAHVIYTKGTQCTTTASDMAVDDDIQASSSEYFSTEMSLNTLLSPHTTRSEALSAVLKYRYKSLIERAKGEFAWLQLKKQRYKSKGLHERIAAIRNQQQVILKKMESERNVIQQLLESALATPYLRTGSRSPTRQRPKLTPSRSAPDVRAGLNDEPPLSLSERLDRVEYMLAWNFKLDEKEAEIGKLEHMLLECNYNADITAETSTKSLLYRISKVEKRLSKISEKLATLDILQVEDADAPSIHSINEEEELTAEPLIESNAYEQQRGAGKLNQIWQSLKSQKHRKYTPKRGIVTKFKHNFNGIETAGFNDFRSKSTESSSSQYVVYDPVNCINDKRHTTSTDDDGIVVLYSPKVPSVNSNINSCRSDHENNEKENLSTKFEVTNSTTFSHSKRSKQQNTRS